MEIKNDIGKGVRKRLEDLQASPNSSVWENIEHDLNKEKDDTRPILFWWRYGIGLLILLLSLLGGVSIFHKNDLNNKPNKTSKTNSKEQSKSVPSSTFSNTSDYNIESPNSESDTQKVAPGSNFSTASNNTNYWYTQVTGDNIKSRKIENPTQSNHHLTTNGQPSIPHKKSTKTELNEKNRFNRETSKNSSSSNDSISAQETEELKNLENAKDLKKNRSSKKDSIEKKSDKNKWSVYPNVALTSYGAFGKNVSNQTSFNFGIYATYFGSEKLNIRLGLNRLNLNQSWTETSNHYTQKVNYTEASLELRYFIVKKKLAPFVTGGFGYHFMNNAELESKIGETIYKTKNNTQFQNSTASINLGLGAQLQLIPHFYFNLEGGFKYLFSPYKNPEDFNPYIITIMSGIEYKF